MNNMFLVMYQDGTTGMYYSDSETANPPNDGKTIVGVVRRDHAHRIHDWLGKQ